MSRIALATTIVPATDPDREIDALAAELRGRGLAADQVYWWQPDVDWAGYDLVLLKSPWDYPQRVDEFLDWLARVEQVTTVRNHPDLVRWNLDKHYLGQLQARGVDCVPVTYCPTREAARAALGVFATGNVVVKPTVSAGSRDTGLFAAGDPAATDLADRILDLGKVVMVQPAIPSVSEVGERALLFFGGRFSHAVRKGPLLALGGGLIGGEYIESIEPATAPDDELALAADALAVAERLCLEAGLSPEAARTTYARVDVARAADDRPVVMELELFEPSYFCDLAPGSVSRVADALVASLK